MPASRVALYLLSLASVIVAVRGMMGKPVAYVVAAALAGVYAALLLLGARLPRLQLFADVIGWVADDEVAIVVRCDDADVSRWLQLLAVHDLAVTFSLPELSDDTRSLLAGSQHALVKRVDGLAMGAVAQVVKSLALQNVKMVDMCVSWHFSQLGRLLRQGDILWLAPRLELPAERPSLGVRPGDVLAVRGIPREEAIAKWQDEIAEARLRAIALR